MGRRVFVGATLLFLVALRVEAQNQAITAKDYLNKFASTFDRDRLKSGFIKYTIEHGDGRREQVTWVFNGERSFQRLTSFTNGIPVVNCEWSNGVRSVYGVQGKGWSFVIRRSEAGVRNRSWLFLHAVCNYRHMKDPLFASLEALEVRRTTEGTEYSFRDTRTQRKLTFLTVWDKPEVVLPARVRSMMPDGTVAAEWSYEGWQLREGGAWFPSRCLVSEFWGSFPETNRPDEKTIYSVEHARFNIPVSEAWLTPQYPSGARITDGFSDTERVLFIDKFDFMSDFSVPSVGQKVKD